MTRSVLWVLAAVGLAPAPSPRPRLVVVITVDQLRPDYLDRYRPQLQGGLRLLLREGAVFRDAYQDHAVTETAPGHSTILSGRWPAHTGIIANTVGVLDSTAPMIGLAGPGAVPARFPRTEVFGWLPAAEPGPRAPSGSPQGRGAALRIRRGQQSVYWDKRG